MIYQQTTQVPNIVFDHHLPSLTESELKLLLVIIRQTNGWYDKTTGRRKTRDRISHGQFMKKTGLCRRVLSKSLQSLIEKELITVTCENGRTLHKSEERKGMARLFYSFQNDYPMYPIRPCKIPQVKQIGEILIANNYRLAK